jgi:hypothetical protein
VSSYRSRVPPDYVAVNSDDIAWRSISRLTDPLDAADR